MDESRRDAALFYLKLYGGLPDPLPPPPTGLPPSSSASAHAGEHGKEHGRHQQQTGEEDAKDPSLSIPRDLRAVTMEPSDETEVIMSDDVEDCARGRSSFNRHGAGGETTERTVKYATLRWIVRELISNDQTDLAMRSIVVTHYASFTSASELLRTIRECYEQSKMELSKVEKPDGLRRSLGRHYKDSYSMRSLSNRPSSRHAPLTTLAEQTSQSFRDPSAADRSQGASAAESAEPPLEGVTWQTNPVAGLVLRQASSSFSVEDSTGRRRTSKVASPGEAQKSSPLEDDNAALRTPLKVLALLQVWLNSAKPRRELLLDPYDRRSLGKLLTLLEEERLGPQVDAVRDLCWDSTSGESLIPPPQLPVRYVDPVLGPLAWSASSRESSAASEKDGHHFEEMMADCAAGLANYTAREIAEEMTRSMARWLTTVSRPELLDKAWMRKSDPKADDSSDERSGGAALLAPNIVDITERYNAMSRWIQSTVLVGKQNAEGKADLVRKWVQVAEELLAMNNFLSMSAVVQGVHPKFSVLLMLRSMWACLGEKVHERILELNRYCAYEDNYAAYRDTYSMIQASGRARIPFLPAMLKDIAGLYDGLATHHRQKPHLIHLRKFFQIDGLLREFETDQQSMESFLIAGGRESHASPRTTLKAHATAAPKPKRGFYGDRGTRARVGRVLGLHRHRESNLEIPEEETAGLVRPQSLVAMKTLKHSSSAEGGMPSRPSSLDGIKSRRATISGDSERPSTILSSMELNAGDAAGLRASSSCLRHSESKELHRIIERGLELSLSTNILRSLADKAETSNLERQHEVFEHLDFLAL